MNKEMFDSLVARAGCKTTKDGRATLPAGRTLTLHVSHKGGSLQVGRVVELRLDNSTLEALDDRAEIFLVALEDVFAASVSGVSPSSPARKAGFLG